MEIKISFESIKKKCKTIGELRELEREVKEVKNEKEKKGYI